MYNDHLQFSTPRASVHNEEKDIPITVEPAQLSPVYSDDAEKASPPLATRLQRWAARLERLTGVEDHGIERVSPDQRDPPGSLLNYLQMVFLWFSANVSINNLAVGLCGPLVYNLGFVDSSICAVLGAFFGAISTAYMGTWGAESGSRTMVVVRYFMGYWPARICAVLNIILMLGYCTIDCIIGGQVLSAVSGGSMSIAVGIVVVAIVVLVIAGFGLKVFHHYERWAWLPQVIVLLILAGCARNHFDTSLPSIGNSATIVGNRLSFFSLIFYVPNSWAGAASDFYVCFDSRTPKHLIFILTLTGLTLSFALVNMVGVALGSGVVGTPSWSDAYAVSSGALITEGYAPLDGFGKFCAVVVALGVIANNVPGTYTNAVAAQTLGRYGKAVPRMGWVVIMVVIQLVCSLVGRNELFTIFTNFLALMGYWLMVMICIVLEEHVIFKPRVGGFDWSAWDDQKKLPVGLAALAAFLLGWVGAILGMFQVWYVGPIAALIGDGGADVGMYIGCAFTLIVFPPLRWLEIKKFGR